MGFNPCFTGTSSHTAGLTGVNCASLLFQSLFYWNLLSYFSVPALVSTSAGFNPCFTGTSSHTGELKPIEDVDFAFQSLFYWNLLSYLQSKLLLLHQGYVSILVLLEPPLIHIPLWWKDKYREKFQSLFYWNLLSYLSSSFLSLNRRCVSILVLLEPPLIPI